jgi:transcriptional regulator with XRE-family HTH domain
MDIGYKIKQLRQKNALTQEELAIRCDLSPGFISQMERDLASPSISTLEAILVALGETLQNFFTPESELVIIGRQRDVCKKVFDKQGYDISWIVPNAQKFSMEPILIHIKKDGKTRLEIPHEGEEFGYVVSGEVSLVLNEKEYEIKEKESFYFMPYKDHYLVNKNKKTAEVLWVSCPPNF